VQDTNRSAEINAKCFFIAELLNIFNLLSVF
jgi:hypothetical protein